MTLYYYRAKTPQGRAMEGTIDSVDQREAARILRGRGLLVTALSESRDPGPRGTSSAPGRVGARQPSTTAGSARPARPSRGVGPGGSTSGSSSSGLGLTFSRTIGLKELSLFCRQFATMLEAGVAILTSLNILARQASSKRLRMAIAQVAWGIEQGHSLSNAFLMRRDVFPTILINMVSAGEAGGVLEESFTRLADHFEKEHAVSQKVRSAMTYPAVVSTLAVAVVIFMLVYVMPTFVGIFASIGGELPSLTRAMIGLSDFIIDYWYLLLGGLLLLIVGLKLAGATERGAYSLDLFMMRMPIFGDLILKRAVSRFARTLGTLLRSGVPLLVCLQVVEQTVGSRPVAVAVNRATEDIRAGRGIAEPLRASGLFPPMVLEMLAVGEETGAVDQMLTRAADFYDKDIDTAVERLASSIEPIIIVVLGSVVGFILISLMLPMFDVYSQLDM